MLSSVSFFCPAYNDEKNLPELIPNVFNFLKRISNASEIIIIEDGSPDKTGLVADELARQFENVKVLHHKKNMGYGEALKDGFLNARYDYVLYTDGDNQYDIGEMEPYLRLLSEADVLSGYATKKVLGSQRKLQTWVYNFLIRILFGVKLEDINCSMKIYKKSVLDKIKIKSRSAFIDAEMLIKVKRLGYKIEQFPVTQYRRKHGLASGSSYPVVKDTIMEMIKFKLGKL